MTPKRFKVQIVVDGDVYLAFESDNWEMGWKKSWPRPKKGQTSKQPMSSVTVQIKQKGNVVELEGRSD